MNSCLPKQLLPGNFFTDKRTAVTQAAYYPGTLLPVHTLYLHVHHACFINVAQIKWVFFSTLTHSGRATILFKPVRVRTQKLFIHTFANFLQQLLRRVQYRTCQLFYSLLWEWWVWSGVPSSPRECRIHLTGSLGQPKHVHLLLIPMYHCTLYSIITKKL